MAEFTTYEEMAKNVAEKALDDFLYNGKSIREWMQIIASEDCISRKAVLDMVEDMTDQFGTKHRVVTEGMISMLPPVKPKPKTDEPMQVDLEGDGYADGKLVYDYGKCPKCGWEFEEGDKDWEEPYCCHCGQKLHWFESGEQE